MTRPALVVVRLGRVAYADALALQHDLVRRRAAGSIRDHLLLLEHDAVLTIGRGGDDGGARTTGVPVVEIERGGEATWHGPGQLVGYPILALDPARRDLHRYLRDLEEVLIRAVAEFGVAATRNPPHTGVWVGARKIASLGVAVKRWVTFHGFALNVDCELAAFRGFHPCGLDPAVMTSLANELRAAPDRDAVDERVTERFAEVFERDVVRSSAIERD